MISIQPEFHGESHAHYFAIDDAAARDEEGTQALGRLLEQWEDQVRQLTTVGGTVYLPFDFSDQCTGWFRVTSHDGRLAHVEAGWSGVEGWTFSPSAIAETARSISDFKPVAGVVADCSLDELLSALAANRESLRTDGH